MSSFPELGLAGPDTLSLVGDGTLAMAHIYGGYVAGHLPAIEVQVLWGAYPSHEITYKSQTSMHPELEAIVLAETGGVVVNHNWFSGVDQYFFCHDKIESMADFKGLKTRSHSAALSDWINGMGAQAQFVAFSEVYTALERGILDCGVTGADPAYGQRWYEVTKYMNGPLISLTSTNNVVNSQVWEKMPDDLRQIFIEEGAKSELEALRLMAIQNEVGTEKNIRAGLEMVLFSPEMVAASDATLTSHVIPNWLRRLGGPDHPAVQLFNDKVAPWIGLKINPDGSTSEIPITKK